MLLDNFSRHLLASKVIELLLLIMIYIYIFQSNFESNHQQVSKLKNFEYGLPGFRPPLRRSKINWCSELKYLDPPREPVALASFPGSGNTWLRYLLQQATGTCASNPTLCPMTYFFLRSLYRVRLQRLRIVKKWLPSGKHLERLGACG